VSGLIGLLDPARSVPLANADTVAMHGASVYSLPGKERSRTPYSENAKRTTTRCHLPAKFATRPSWKSALHIASSSRACAKTTSGIPTSSPSAQQSCIIDEQNISEVRAAHLGARLKEMSRSDKIYSATYSNVRPRSTAEPIPGA
jgi:hypothetical protein